MPLKYIAVGLEGALGAIARVALSHLIPAVLCTFPLRILVVNILGCFCIGLLTESIAFFWTPQPVIKQFLISGFLGSFTTYSAFALEAGLLYEQGDHTTAWVYTIVSVALCFLFFFLGMLLVRTLAGTHGA